MAAIIAAQEHDPAFLRFVDAAEAGALAGRPVRGPGWWMPSGSWVSPGSLAVALLARAGQGVRRYLGRRVERLEREGADWRALDAEGSVIAEAPTIVLANAFDTKRLLPEARLRLASVRGQVSFLPSAPERALDIVVSGSGYVAPLPDGGHVVGATYQHDDAGDDIRVADHRENLARAVSMLPGFADGIDPSELDGLAGHRPRPAADRRRHAASRRLDRHRAGIARAAVGAHRRRAHRLEARGRALAPAARPRRRDLAAPVPLVIRSGNPI
jgi:tRNA 5-methylaminomethyl-2-thiouridine biosynthesis bifunctional protein